MQILFASTGTKTCVLFEMVRGEDIFCPSLTMFLLQICFRIRRRHSSKSSAHSSIRSSGPPTNVLENIVVNSTNKHIATSHQDTTEGAVHCFQDEYGKIKLKGPICGGRVSHFRLVVRSGSFLFAFNTEGYGVVHSACFYFQEIGSPIHLERTAQGRHWAC